MANFSYTISPFLKKELETLDLLRNSIALELLAPRDELKMQWEATIDRIYYSLSLSQIKVGKRDVLRVISLPGKPTTKSPEKEIYGYKKSLDILKQNWIYEPDKSVSIHSLIELFTPTFPSFSAHSKELSKVLKFLQINPEPPIIQAGLGFAMVNHALGDNNDSKRVATLISYLFLYKAGYYFRNMVVLEEHFSEHKAALEGALLAAYKRDNLSPFLDFFIFAVEDQIKKTLLKMRSKTSEITYPESYFELTQRQKEIMAMLDNPGMRVTNKMVQKHFKVSQITASRELAKLASLGLALSLGKGRSVYYTKA